MKISYYEKDQSNAVLKLDRYLETDLNVYASEALNNWYSLNELKEITLYADYTSYAILLDIYSTLATSLFEKVVEATGDVAEMKPYIEIYNTLKGDGHIDKSCDSILPNIMRAATIIAANSDMIDTETRENILNQINEILGSGKCSDLSDAVEQIKAANIIDFEKADKLYTVLLNCVSTRRDIADRLSHTTDIDKVLKTYRYLRTPKLDLGEEEPYYAADDLSKELGWNIPGEPEDEESVIAFVKCVMDRAKKYLRHKVNRTVPEDFDTFNIPLEYGELAKAGNPLDPILKALAGYLRSPEADGDECSDLAAFSLCTLLLGDESFYDSLGGRDDLPEKVETVLAEFDYYFS